MLFIVDVIRTGRKRNLFRPDNLISGKDDSGNVFARGYYTMADDLRELTMDKVRKLVSNFLRKAIFVSTYTSILYIYCCKLL